VVTEALAIAMPIRWCGATLDDPECDDRAQIATQLREFLGHRDTDYPGIPCDEWNAVLGLAQLHVGHHLQSEGRRLATGRRTFRVLQRTQWALDPSSLSLDLPMFHCKRLVFPVDACAGRQHVGLPWRRASARTI